MNNGEMLLHVLVSICKCFTFLLLAIKYLKDYNKMCKWKRGIFISELNAFLKRTKLYKILMIKTEDDTEIWRHSMLMD